MTEKERGVWERSDALGIVLLIAAIASLWTFVDWGAGAVDETESRYAACAEAERALGDSIYRERPDCREVLEGRQP